VPYVHRVLSAKGEISPGWRPAGPGVPATAREVERTLRDEGVRFVDGRADQRQRWRPGDAGPRAPAVTGGPQSAWLAVRAGRRERANAASTASRDGGWAST
jgi:hypothetical protein